MRKETVAVRNLVTGYTDRHHNEKIVTAGIDAKLYSGEFTCLLGPNGAGKSTLLRTLSGFQPPLGGSVEVEGKSLTDYTPAELSRVIGVVLTDKPELTNMKVEELVGLGRAPYTGFWGRLSEQDRNIIDEAMGLVGIEALKGRSVDTLSDGERQKVMIAKALAQETPIIFLDEPTAFLDYPSKVEVMQLLRTLSRVKDKTVFLSTHDLELALQIADKAWLIDKKLGVATGTPEDLSLNGKLGRYFEREGIRLDADSGLFKVEEKASHKVALTGDTSYRPLVSKALSRIGVATDGDVDSAPVITVSDGRYRFGDGEYASIEGLVNAVNEEIKALNEVF